MSKKTLTPHQKGGLKTRETCKQRYGKDFYHRLGLKGGNPYLLEIRRKKLEEQNCSTEPSDQQRPLDICQTATAGLLPTVKFER